MKTGIRAAFFVACWVLVISLFAEWFSFPSFLGGPGGFTAWDAAESRLAVDSVITERHDEPPTVLQLRWPVLAGAVFLALLGLTRLADSPTARRVTQVAGVVLLALVVTAALGEKSREPGWDLGIGFFLAVAAIVVALLATMLPAIFRQIGAGRGTSARHKRCPDCAERVFADARVCRHCGYRFEPPVEP